MSTGNRGQSARENSASKSSKSAKPKKVRGRARKANQRVSEGNFVIPSPLDIVRGKSYAGAWSAATLASWGISWPPPEGWREFLRRLHLERPGGTHDVRFTREYRDRWKLSPVDYPILSGQAEPLPVASVEPVVAAETPASAPVERSVASEAPFDGGFERCNGSDGWPPIEGVWPPRVEGEKRESYRWERTFTVRPVSERG